MFSVVRVFRQEQISGPDLHPRGLLFSFPG